VRPVPTARSLPLLGEEEPGCWQTAGQKRGREEGREGPVAREGRCTADGWVGREESGECAVCGCVVL
jgi:hypothetical protein